MNNPAAETEFHQRIEKLESLLRDLEACADPATRSKAIEAVQTLMEFHGTGISKLIEHIAKAGDAGKSILAAAANDDLVASLLLLYGLHPDDFDSRVRQGAGQGRPSHPQTWRRHRIARDGRRRRPPARRVERTWLPVVNRENQGRTGRSDLRQSAGGGRHSDRRPGQSFGLVRLCPGRTTARPQRPFKIQTRRSP